jgi:hypothetical protein
VSDVWAGATTIMKDYGSKFKMTMMTRMHGTSTHRFLFFSDENWCHCLGHPSS